MLLWNPDLCILIPKLPESDTKKHIPKDEKSQIQHKQQERNGYPEHILTSDVKVLTHLCDNLSIEDLKATDEKMDYFIDS